jgi:hypothetical protein
MLNGIIQLCELDDSVKKKGRVMLELNLLLFGVAIAQSAAEVDAAKDPNLIVVNQKNVPVKVNSYQ